jgi:hypothetical protein
MTPASAGRFTLPDGSYIDGNYIPWQHVCAGGRHPAGTCAACMPADNQWIPYADILKASPASGITPDQRTNHARGHSNPRIAARR